MKQVIETAGRKAMHSKTEPQRLRIRLLPRGTDTDLSAKAAEVITTS